jgi:uncharacterized protein (DUF2147 family)
MRRRPLLAVCLLALAAGSALAQPTPVGLWKTVDDETKAERSLSRISEAPSGALSGRVERILEADKASARCEKCSDERKGQPVLGMTLIRNAQPDAAHELWEGGDILDPANGKVYRLRLKPLDGGKRLEVRGYIGPFFRSQQWIRVE